MPEDRERAAESREHAKRLKCIMLLPTYNNAKTLAHVVADAMEWCGAAMVVNDGSTDDTAEILKGLRQEHPTLEVVEYADGKNRGKGYALKTGLRRAAELGYRYAVSMDTDGQHFAQDLPNLLKEEDEHPNTFVIGSRNLQADGMPGKNTFANKFSNFWYKVETLISLDDTQSGYRVYPLELLRGMTFFTPRYEFEVEVAVRMAWQGARVVNVPIRVLYPEDRVSHFRPGPDFFRISVLNTVLVLIALVWYYPVALWRWIKAGNLRKFLNDNLLHSPESTARLSAAVGLGSCIAVAPIWGLQTLTAIGLAHVLRLNKIVVTAFATMSIPPIIPFIIYGGVMIGSKVTGLPVDITFSQGLNREAVKNCALQYFSGGAILAIAVGLAATAIAYVTMKIFRHSK